jgi:LPXTG-motif cell wall-anchored protein
MRKKLTAILATATLVLVPSAIAFASYTWSDSAGSSAAWYSLAVSDSGLIAYSSQYDGEAPFEAPLLKSVDGGATWSTLPFDYTGAAKQIWRSVSTSADGTVVAAIGYNDGEWTTQINVSNNAGSSFNAVGPVREWMDVAVAGDGNTIVAVEKEGSGHLGGVWKWTRASNTWVDITPSDELGRFNGDWRTVSVSTDGSRVLATRDTFRVYVSADAGATWSGGPAVTSGLWLSSAMSGDGRLMIATLDYGNETSVGAWFSSNFGQTWQRSLSGPGYISSAISRDGSTVVVARYPGAGRPSSLLVSRDKGGSWIADPSSPANYPWSGVALGASGERLVVTADDGRPMIATSTTTTTTTTTTTVAPATTEAPATTAATTTSSSTTTTTATSTTVAATTTSTIVDSPPPAVTPSMVETFKPKPLVKDEQVAAGETVTVRISGFQPFELVSIGFDDESGVSSQAVGDSVRAFAGRKVLVTVRADATGTISVQAKLPTTVSGPVTLWAYGRESKVGFRQKFTVAELPATGSEDPGMNVMLAGSLVASGVVLFGLRRRLRG